MEIRILNAGDAQAYWDVRLEALEHDPEAFSASAEDHRTLPLNELAQRGSPEPAHSPHSRFVIGVFEDNRLIGTAGFFRDKGIKERHKGHIWGVYLTQKARGKGIGRRMMEAALDQARRLENLEQILLAVGQNQAAAAQLYRSLGFVSYGCEPRALKVGGHYIDEETMILFLGPDS